MPVAREPFTATAVIADATEVIAAAEAISFDVPRDRYVHVLYGVGALAYSRAHLLAMVALAHARR